MNHFYLDSHKTFFRRILSLCLPLLAIMLSQNVLAQETAKIIEVKPSQDLQQIAVDVQGAFGKHSAFVLEKPYRLVLDIDQAVLGRLPGKIPIGRAGIQEIRIGSVNQKARVVVDYGDSPVPPFSVDRVEGGILLALGSHSDYPIVRNSQQFEVKPAAHHGKPPVQVAQRKPKPANPVVNTQPRLIIRSTGVENEQIFIDVAELGNKAASARIVLDYDRKSKQIQGAGVRDDSGVLKKYDVTAKNELDAEKMLTRGGPRKNTDPINEMVENSPVMKKKFQWGMVTEGLNKTETEPQVPKNTVVSRMPLKMEAFELKPK